MIKKMEINYKRRRKIISHKNNRRSNKRELKRGKKLGIKEDKIIGSIIEKLR